MLLNDGYLVLNPACFESINDEHSPLRVLINQRYIRILSRNRSPSLVSVVTTGKHQGIETYKKLLADKKKWKATQKALEAVELDINNKSGFVCWPRLNLTHSYLELIRFLAQLPYEQIGLDKVPEATFKRIVERFDKELTTEPSTPRSKWERIVKEEVSSGREILSLTVRG